MTLVSYLALMPAMNRPPVVDEQWTIGQYTIESAHEPNGDRRLTIVKGGQEVFSKTAPQYWFVDPKRAKEGGTSYKPVVMDVTGDGVPDLVLETFPLHSQCCWSYSVIELGKSVKEVATAGGFPSPMTFEDVNGDGIYELTGDDWIFYSWYAGPRVILRYDKGEYRVASHLMRRPTPTKAELSAKANQYRKATVYAGFPVAPEVYRYMLDLIYSGNSAAAWEFLDIAWPKERTGKQEFIAQIKEQLTKSRFWEEVAKLAPVNRSISRN